MGKVFISPSILSADFANLERDIKRVENAGADWLHIDVMDGHFVPNITIGVPVVASIDKVTNMPLDVHLMIENPQKYVEAFAKAGADILTFHIECGTDVKSTIDLIKSFNVKVGLSIKPNTKIEDVYEFLPYIHMCLIMTVEPGKGGQSLILETLEKIKELKRYIEENKIEIDIEADGGINLATVEDVKKAGANILVAGTAILMAKDYKIIIDELKKE